MFKFVALFNILANSEERIDRLEKALESIPSEIEIQFSIRIRGSHQRPISTEKQNIKLYFGSTWEEWNLDLLQQVVDSPATHYLLLQEDHLLQMRSEEFSQLLSEVAIYGIDYLPLSFHPQYGSFVKEISSKFETNSGVALRYWNISLKNFKTIDVNARNYPLNLIGIYTKTLLESLLLRERPIYKKYSIDAPFNFERPPHETWFMPLDWGYPKSEVFACIDDDHGFPGYSLFTRLNFQGSLSLRTVNHHESGLIFGELPSILSSGKQILIKVLPSRLLVLPRNLKYTWKSLRGFRRRRRIQKRLLREF